MSVYIKYLIHALEPLKMGKQGNQTATESLSYIAGSALRGAVISAYIKNFCNGNLENAEEVEQRSVLKNTKFFNAYPCVEGKMLLPTPAVYYADKHLVRGYRRSVENGEKKELEIHSCAGLTEIPKEGEQRLDIGKYVDLSNNEVMKPFAVKMDAKLHIALAKEGEKSKMFRYEAIAPEQTFLGIIECDEAQADKYMKLLAMTDGEECFYLGGSRGSGYGRCVITQVQKCSYEELFDEQHEKDASNMLIADGNTFEGTGIGVFSIYAASNLLLVDENGKNIGAIPVSYLEESLGVTGVKLEKAYVSASKAEGFNHTWRARQVQQTAVSAGSVFLYTYQGELSKEKITALEKKGVGQRKPEGFGRILINANLRQKARKDWELVRSSCVNTVEKLSVENQVIVDDTLQNIVRNRVRTIVDKEALGVEKQAKNIIKSLSLTQTSKLYNLLYYFETSGKGMTDQEIVDKINDFRNDVKSIAKDAYEKTKLPLGVKEGQNKVQYISKSIIDVLRDLVDDNVSLGDWNPKLELAVREAGIDSVVTDMSVLQMKILYLSKIFYNIMRMEGGK